MTFNQYVGIIILGFFSVFVFGCESHDISEGITESRFYSPSDMYAHAAQFGMTTNQIGKASQAGIYSPLDSLCKKQVDIAPLQHFEWKEALHLHQDNKKDELRAVAAFLYQLLGESLKVEDDNLGYKNVPIVDLLEEVAKGSLKPLCGASSRITSRLLNEYYTEYRAMDVNLKVINHIITAVYFSEENVRYAVALDIQNGYLYPVKPNNELYCLEEISLLTRNDSLFCESRIEWLPESVLVQKRLFVEEVLPCNFLSQSTNSYAIAPEESGYPLEKRGYAFHKYLWFDLAHIDIDPVKADIIDQLLLNQ